MAKRSEYCVHEGRPSWSQARAGAISAGKMCFTSRRLATGYMRRVRKLRPTETVFLIVSKARGGRVPVARGGR